MWIRALGGIAVTAVLLFIWGFVYWGLSPLPYQTWKSTTDDTAAQRTLRELFPEDGLYTVPGISHGGEELSALLRQGPRVMAFVEQSPPAGADPAGLAFGFLQQVLIAALLALILPYGEGFGGRLKLAALAGLTSLAVTDLTDVIWWRMSPAWEACQMIYNLSVWIIGAAVLSPFIRGTPAQQGQGGALRSDAR